jgi:hypothetical protein
MTNILPSDTSSLLVPVHLDAWVVDSQNQEGLAWYYADYNNLTKFASPIPEPFYVSDENKPTVGIHLHWALPDALTHGRQSAQGCPIEFPLVPNRWLVARFNASTDASWQCKLWVVKSDHLGSEGTSAFLDPFNPSTMEVTPGQKPTINLNQTNIGKTYTIEAWEAEPVPDTGQLHLQAVGPGNVAFAAYAPFVKDVFSFTDTDLPPDDTGVHSYTYLVVGWYSDTSAADPLRAIATYPSDSLGIWKSRQGWLDQSPMQRFQTLMTDMKWSVQGDVDPSPPTNSLYHGMVIDVQWPYSTLGNAGINTNNVQVAVGNTAIDALAALIHAEAQKQAKADATDQNAWLAAGETLPELLQAALYDLLNDYGKIGGSAFIQQQIQQAWFGSNPGGIVWEAVSHVPQSSGDSSLQPVPAPDQAEALNKKLAALNQSQRDLDQNQRQLESLRSDLYIIWWKIARANSFDKPWQRPHTTPSFSDIKSYLEEQIYPDLFNRVWDQLCAVTQKKAQLPDPIDDTQANQWANENWTFPKAGGGSVSLSDLGLKLKASTMPRFWHPNDPVVLISGLNRSQKHGEDGRYNSDGTLTCRLPGQTISGPQVPDSFNLDQYTKIPCISKLISEALFVERSPNPSTWVGTTPAPFAINKWEQAWTPLFLEWSVKYFPTGSGEDVARQFSLDDWQFDGEQYTWKGSGFDPDYFVSYKGRTLLTAQAPLFFKSKIEKYLKSNTSVDSTQVDTLIATVAGWDLLSQSLSGLTDQIITLLAQETFPPPPADDPSVLCPRPQSGGTRPSVSVLIGDGYQAVPQLTGDRENLNYFYPVRGGFLQMDQLQIVDAFGQTYGGSTSDPLSSWLNTGQGFQPILGQGLAPTIIPDNFPVGMIQLPPRVIQSAQLSFNYLANDGSGQDIIVSENPNAVCGWLLPNHLDGGIAVYDAGGYLLGELLPLERPHNWRPRPGPPGTNPPPQQPADISNSVLRAVVSSMANQSATVFDDLLNVVDETLWMVDPLGGRKDQFLSVLIGRPLAVVQAELKLELFGHPAFNQMWNDMLPPEAPYSWLQDIGDVEDLWFPVRLGSLQLRNDGLIGYYLSGGSSPYSTFYAVHYPDDVSAGDSYIKQIVKQNGNGGPAQYQGDINLKFQGDSVTVTMIMDPRGAVHAYTGILPVTTAALPAYTVEEFIKRLKVMFRTGPIMADPGTLRIPKPAEDHGVWNWIQALAPPANWKQDEIEDADDRARLPDGQLQLREGWLQLSDIDEPGS